MNYLTTTIKNNLWRSKNIFYLLVSMCIALAVGTLLPTIAQAQFNNSQLVTKIWNHVTGNPGDTLNWTAEVLDASRNLVVIGNNLQSNQTTDMLLTKYKASDGSVLWQVQYDNNGYDDFGIAVVVDPSRNIYTATASFVNTTNGYDWIVQKYDSNGTAQWTKTLNSGFYDVPTDMKYDGSGHLYVTGVRTTTTTLQDYCTVKYDASNGNELWAAPSIYDYTNLVDIPAAITIEGSGRIIVAGGSGSTLTNWDFATVKYSPGTGAQVNVTRNSSSGLGFDQPTAIAKDQYDNIYVTGYAAITGNGYDIKIVKLDTALSTVWSVTYDGGDHLDDRALGIGVDANGYVYVTGYATKTNGGTDIVTIKYNQLGTLQWVKKYSAPDPTKKAIGRKLDIDPYGNILIVGDAYNIGNTDILALAYDVNGNKKWEEWYNGAGNGNDVASAIKIDDASDYFYVTGKIWTGTAYQYATIKYQTIDYITPPDTEKCPTSFAYFENRGQVIGTNDSLQPNVKFYTTGYSPTMYFQNGKINFALSRIDANPSSTDTIIRVDLSFNNGLSTKPYYISPFAQDYLNYNKPWCGNGITAVRGYQRLLYPEIYRSIDAMFYANRAGSKYYLICKVGSRPSDIALKFTGADSIKILGNGHLKIYTKLGSIEQENPTAFQIDASGNIITLNWQPTYSSLGSNKFGFNLGSYDLSKPLIITLRRMSGTPCTSTSNGNQNWGTFYGNQEDDLALDQCNDPTGNLYVVGTTESAMFPVLNNVQLQFNGINDGFIIKFDQYAVRKWATLYGGSDYDAIQSVMYNSNLATNSLFVCGNSLSTDLVTNSAGQANEYYKSSNSGGKDALIGQLDPVFGTIYYSTYFGGSGNDDARSIVQGGDGANFFVAGNTTTTAVSNNLCGVPTNNGFPLCDPSGTMDFYQDHNAGGQDIFVSRFGTSDNLLWSTFYGSNGDEKLYEISLVQGGPQTESLYITGSTTKADATNTNNCAARTDNGFPYCDMNGGNDYFEKGVANNSSLPIAFVAQFLLSGHLNWATNFNNVREFQSITNDWKSAGNPAQNVYVTGVPWFFATGTTSCSPQTGFNCPVCQNGSSYNANAGSVYVAKFSTQDNSLKWSTFYNNAAQSWTDITQNPVISGGQSLNPTFDKFMDIACDASGDSYITGGVYNGGLPNNWFDVFPSIPSGAYYQATIQGGVYIITDCFILSFNEANQRVWATHYGGNDDIGYSLDYPDNFDLPTSIIAYKTDKLFLVGYCGKEYQYAGEFDYPCFDPGPQPTGDAYYFDNDPDYEHGIFNWDAFIGRFDLASIHVNVDDIAYSQNALFVYPNPSGGIVNIKFPEGLSGDPTISVKSVLGQTLFVVHINLSQGSNHQIDLSTLSSGVYLFDIIIGGNHLSQKVIKY